MLDRKTEKAMQFLKKYYVSFHKAEKMQHALKILEVLMKENGYTVNSRYTISKQLICDIMDAQITVNKRYAEEREKRMVAAEKIPLGYTGEELPEEKAVEAVCKKAQRKYKAKESVGVRLCPEFISAVIDMKDAVSTEFHLGQLEANFKAGADEAEGLFPRISSEMRDIFEPIFSGLSSIEEADSFLQTNREKEAIWHLKFALDRIGHPENMFDMRLKFSNILVKAGDYEEAIRQIYKGLLRFKSGLLYGKPDTKTTGSYLVVETTDGERIGCEQLFEQIQDAVSIVKKIPEKELSSDEGNQLFDLIKFTVLKLECLHKQQLRTADDKT